MIGDLLWQRRAEKCQRIGAFRQIKLDELFIKLRVVQCEIEHQPLSADQDQFAGSPLQLEGAAKVLVRVGRKLGAGFREFLEAFPAVGRPPKKTAGGRGLLFYCCPMGA